MPGQPIGEYFAEPVAPSVASGIRTGNSDTLSTPKRN